MSDPRFIIGTKALFSTTQSDLTKYNGQEVVIRRLLTEKECDIEDVRFMYEVKTYNGDIIQVFEDELG